MSEPQTPAASTTYVRQAGERRSARIESLRALAALGVLVGHAYGWSHGFGGGIYGTFAGRVLLSGGFGVYLFFSLSGYLLFLPFARHAFRGSQIDLRRYAINRAVRILPLYYVVTGTYLLLNENGLRSQWWRFVLFIQGFDDRTVAKVVPPAWSLVVEVQFYILLPLFALLVTALSRRSLRRGVIVVTALAIAALALRLGTVTAADSVSRVWEYSLPATCVFFFPGMLLALLRVRLDTEPARWTSRPVVGSSAAWLSAGVVLWLMVAYRYNLNALLLPASAFLLGACALPLRQGRAVRALDMRWLAGLGAASYSLYLWHGPLVHRLSTTAWVPGGFLPLLGVSLVICSAVAVASYHIVERPFLRLRRSWSPARLPDEVASPQGVVPWPAGPADEIAARGAELPT